MFNLFSFFSREHATAGDLERLTHLVRRYAIEQQQVPQNLFDLVSLKYLEAVPLAPPGQKFVIDRKKVEVRLE
jgi:hypothetical protein